MHRSTALVAAACAVVAAIPYVFGAAPASYWLDSAEFAAAAWDLGIAHPPGHPLAALVNRLVCYMPVGSIAFRAGLASALLTVGAVVVLCLISAELLELLPPRGSIGGATPGGRRVARWLAVVFGALSPAFAYALWFNAVRAEVYALNLFLLLLGVYLLLRGRRLADGRHTVASAFVFGLALCNHHLLALLALPGALLLLPARPWRGAGRRALLGALVATLVALAVLAYLPLRSQQAPRVNWGAPHTLGRFVWVVSAKAFQRKSADRAGRETVEHRGIGAVYAVVAGPPSGTASMVVGGMVLLLGLYGLLLLARSGRVWVALGLGVLLLLNLLGPMLVGFDPYNPDAYGYLALAVALLGPLAAVALFVIVETTARGRSAVATGLLVVALVLPSMRLVLNWPLVDLHTHWAADDTAHELLALPPGALLVSSYFQTIFGLWALQSSEDARPDVQVVHRGFAAQPGYRNNTMRRQPALSQLLETWGREGELTVDNLRPLAATRHVAVEYDLNMSPALTRALVPHSLTLRLGPTSQLSRQQVADHERRIRAYQGGLEPVRDLETRRALVWRHYLLARFSCGRGLRQLAAFHLEAAQRLAPLSRHVLSLAQACLGPMPGHGPRGKVPDPG